MHRYIRLKVTQVFFLTALALVGPAIEVALAATSVSQYGITWTFTQDRQVGQFVNGDWWVVGPVTLSNINPKTTATLDYSNGSMLNPMPGVTQGLYRNGTDTNPQNSPQYTPSKNISLQLPVTVQPGNSIYSTMDNPDTWAATAPEKTWFKETAVLTVVSAPPSAGSFRPPYAGVDKTIKANWNVANMNYGVLRSLAPPVAADVPDRQWLENATVRPLLEMNLNYMNSQWKASWAETKTGGYPRRTYGREISHISSEAGLYLQTNVSNATKQRLMINMCQWGIDIYGLINAGMQWQPNGGHQHGRVMPLYIAAKVLGDSAMLAKCNPSGATFQEFEGHWFVTQTDVDTPRSPVTLAPYTAAMIGMPDWDSGGAPERYKASPDWNWTGYRFINGAPNCCAITTLLLMGGRAEVNCEPWFQYIISRYYPATRDSAAKVIPAYGDVPSLFTRDMWDAYISGITTPPPVVPPVVTFAIGNRIQTTTNTNVRATAALAGTLLGTQATGMLGTIVAGPVVMDNITWWQVDYDNGADGWSGADNLSMAVDQTPVTPPVVTFAIGNRIQTTTNTNVRATAALAGTLLGTQATGMLGTIVAGPVVMDNITWWQVNYDTGADGWSGADNFVMAANQTAPPSPPSGLKVVK